MSDDVPRPTLWVVASGAGGSGSSVFALTLACSLTERGARVVLVDGSMTAPAQHLLLRAPQPQAGLERIRSSTPVSSMLVGTAVPGLQLIPSTPWGRAEDNPDGGMVIRALRRELDADYVILDAGSGVSLLSAGALARADRRLVVTRPDLPSIHATWGLLRAVALEALGAVEARSEDEPRIDQEIAGWLRSPDDPFIPFRAPSIVELRGAIAQRGGHAFLESLVDPTLGALQCDVIFNRSDQERARRMWGQLEQGARRLLQLSPRLCAILPESDAIANAVSLRTPANVIEPESDYVRLVDAIARQQAAEAGEAEPAAPLFVPTPLTASVPIKDRVYQVHSELVVGDERPVFRAVVYAGGRLYGTVDEPVPQDVSDVSELERRFAEHHAKICERLREGPDSKIVDRD